MRLNIGIFGGSFNPIHIGHLALANYLCEYEGLDEVWFLVSPQNPFKVHQELLDDKTRLKLVEAATQSYPRFKASNFEFGLPRPSYTVTTLNALSEAHPDYRFHLIIGADNWACFDKWYKPDEIIAKHHVIVYPRPGYKLEKQTPHKNVRFVHSPVFDISSTFIRNGIKEGKDMQYFLHPKVYDLIMENRLYK